LLDIGCYPIKTSAHGVLAREPKPRGGNHRRAMPSSMASDRLTFGGARISLRAHGLHPAARQAAAKPEARCISAPPGRIWLDISVQSGSERRGRACASMTAATCPAAGLTVEEIRAVRSVHDSGRLISRAQFAKAASRRYRWKIRCANMAVNRRHSSAPPKPASGKSRAYPRSRNRIMATDETQIRSKSLIRVYLCLGPVRRQTTPNPGEGRGRMHSRAQMPT